MLPEGVKELVFHEVDDRITWGLLHNVSPLDGQLTNLKHPLLSCWRIVFYG